MREGLRVFKELIGMGDLQSKVWHTDVFNQIQHRDELTSDHYIVGKNHFRHYYSIFYCPANESVPHTVDQAF